MNRTLRTVLGSQFALLLVAALVAHPPRVQAYDGQHDRVFAPPAPADLKTEVETWLKQRGLQLSPVLETVAKDWEFDAKPNSEELFDVLMRTYYVADADVRTLVDGCREWRYSPNLIRLQLPEHQRDRYEPRFTNNVRYFLARYLTMLTAYNDALKVFEEIDPQHVVDPSGCLFHRAVCEHHLLKKDAGLATLKLLLEQTEGVPVRYRKLGELMRRDLGDVDEKSLGEVARQMKDVERRLTLGQANSGTQEVEQKIIATLDELIKKLEDQQKQKSPSSGMGGGAIAPSTNPAQDSYLGQLRGKGETDKRDIGHKDHWGDLPPKAREAAKNMLEQQFPAHYRQAVEEYLKKLAEQPVP